MSIFRIVQGKPTALKENSFRIEREMQLFVEENLEKLLGLQLVASEYAPQNDLRIDTLAFDKEQKSFAIIEYKRTTNWSVIDQGFSYLSLMLDRKADFVLEVNAKSGSQYSVRDINWEASRILFVSPSFTHYQLSALGFQDVVFELHQLKRYGKDLILLEQLQVGATKAKLSEVKSVPEGARRVQREVRKFSVDDHFRGGWELSRELFDELSERLIELDGRLTIKPVKHYIGFNIGGKNVFSVHARRYGLIFHVLRFQPNDLRDPEHKLRYLTNSWQHYHVHISEMKIKERFDVDYAMTIARQVIAKY